MTPKSEPRKGRLFPFSDQPPVTQQAWEDRARGFVVLICHAPTAVPDPEAERTFSPNLSQSSVLSVRGGLLPRSYYGWHYGSAQLLATGNTFIGWGGANIMPGIGRVSNQQIPACTEVTPDGRVVFQMTFNESKMASYRAFRFVNPPASEATVVSALDQLDPQWLGATPVRGGRDEPRDQRDMAAWKSCNLFAGEGVYLSMLRPLDVTFAHTDQDLLQILMSSATLRVRRVERARIILGAAAGRPDRDLAAELDCSRQCCARTRRRFQAGGFKTLSGDAPGPGWPRRHDHNRIADLTTQTRPANATDWSTRLMAERAAP